MRPPTSPSRPGERSDRDADSLRHLDRLVQRFMAACARMPVVDDVGSREWRFSLRFSSVLQTVRARFPQANAATLAEKMPAVLLVEWMSTVMVEEVAKTGRCSFRWATSVSSTTRRRVRPRNLRVALSYDLTQVLSLLNPGQSLSPVG